MVKLSDFLSSKLNKEQTITIRYNGVDTPETLQPGEESYKDPKNTKFGKTYGVTMQDMYEVVGRSAYVQQKKL